MRVAEVLGGGERRSLELVDAMAGGDRLVAMRAADVVEKLTADRPRLLAPFKARLLGDLAAVAQPEVRWHVALLLARLPLDAAERARAASLLRRWCDDRSRIVQTVSLQALHDLGRADPVLARHARARKLRDEYSRQP